MSLAGRCLGGALLVLLGFAISSVVALSNAIPDSTWVQLKSIPHQGRTALFALAVDPSNNQDVLAGTSDGSLLRSLNGGESWSVVHSGRVAMTTIAYSPITAGVVLAGTHGSGALVSHDSGKTWSGAGGLEGRTVRVFGFALSLFVAGTDQGVYSSEDGSTWTRSTLSDRNIDALAVVAIHPPIRLLAATDSQVSGAGPTLFQSSDGAVTWKQYSPDISGTFAVKLAAGPLPPTGDTRPVVAGTNTGLFASTDNGATFNALSGGALLPTTDYTQVDFITDHYDRYYVASDGGGASGGLWRTDDSGQTFNSLQPPEASVTALAVSNDEQPTLYVATFRPGDHTPVLWAYHDTGGAPQGSSPTPTITATASRTSSAGQSTITQLFDSPQLPYIGLGLGAIAIILTAIGTHLHGRRR